jgi:hypothetical protein
MSMSFQRRPALGLGLSLLAHAAAIAWLALRPVSMPPSDAPSTAMQVRLLRLAPPAVAMPAPAPAPVAPSRHRARNSAATTQTAKAAPVPALAQAAEAPSVIAAAPKDDSMPAATAPAQASNSFEMQAARGTARAWVKGEGKGRGGADGKGAPFLPSRDEKLGQAIERARPADCRNAYAGMGVLAVIPLAASAVTGKGCKW